MGGQGIVLRLIDVVLIILVGFVSIADLSEKSRISFPYTQSEATESDQEEVAIVSIIVTSSAENVRVEQRERWDGSGGFVQSEVALQNPEYLINWKQGEVDVSATADSPEMLEEELQNFINDYGRTIEAVNVVPTADSPVSGTVVVYDIAQRLELPFPGVDLSGDGATAEAAAEGGGS